MAEIITQKTAKVTVPFREGNYFTIPWINITVPQNHLAEGALDPIVHVTDKDVKLTIPHSWSGPSVISTCVQFRDKLVVQGRVRHQEPWTQTEKNGENDASGLCVHEY